MVEMSGTVNSCQLRLMMNTRLVINTVFLADLHEMIIVSRRVFQQRIADVLCGFLLVFSDHGFEV
jgi:hypothetical protein